MNGDPKLYERLELLQIEFDYYEHPPAPTVAIASQYWKDIASAHCKNLFFRNHKGNRHYLVVIDYRQDLSIHDLELRLKQGKLTFASPERMHRFLGVEPGSVTPFGIINDEHQHVKLFLDENLLKQERLTFHPCINTASLVIKLNDFMRFLDSCGNEYEFTELY
ncbi:MAG: prolyl-tRNA synthetase associated domain-containing protein [Bacteroidota bacterium]